MMNMSTGMFTIAGRSNSNYHKKLNASINKSKGSKTAFFGSMIPDKHLARSN